MITQPWKQPYILLKSESSPLQKSRNQVFSPNKQLSSFLTRHISSYYSLVVIGFRCFSWHFKIWHGCIRFVQSSEASIPYFTHVISSDLKQVLGVWLNEWKPRIKCVCTSIEWGKLKVEFVPNVWIFYRKFTLQVPCL